jgi:tetratricopeptide (TPR) repeat protein
MLISFHLRLLAIVASIACSQCLSAQQPNPALYPSGGGINIPGGPPLLEILMDGRLSVAAGEASDPVPVGTNLAQSAKKAEDDIVSMTTLQAPHNAMRSYEKAQRALGHAQVYIAENELRKAVAIYPHFAVAWALLGKVHEKQSRVDEAKADYVHALSADSGLTQLYYRLAEIAFANKRWEDVVQITDELINTTSSGAFVEYFYNAAANFNMGNLAAAEKNARKFQSIDKGRRYPQIFLLLGDILQRKGRYAEAIQQMKDFLSIVPNGPNSKGIQNEIERLEELTRSAPAAGIPHLKHPQYLPAENSKQLECQRAKILGTNLAPEPVEF